MKQKDEPGWVDKYNNQKHLLKESLEGFEKDRKERAEGRTIKFISDQGDTYKKIRRRGEVGYTKEDLLKAFEAGKTYQDRVHEGGGTNLMLVDSYKFDVWFGKHFGK